jgi:hypothetical protein
VEQYGGIRPASRETGIPRATLQDRVRVATKRFSPDAGKVDDERRKAYKGEVGGPPIPDIAIPPEGFVINRNGGAYDAEGNLLRQWVGTVRDAGDVYKIPDGHTVKGESVLVNPEGRTLAKWIKTREDGAPTTGLIEALQTAFSAYDGGAGIVPTPPQGEADADLLTVYPLPDLHFGMYAWGAETGEDFDTDIAADTTITNLKHLISQSRPSKYAVVLGLGDWFHQDDQKNVTPGSGHALDVDSRWARVFAMGAKLATAIVDLVAKKHECIEVRFLQGNHDLSSSMCLTVALSLFYSQNTRITVNTDPGIAWYRKFGNCLLGATHGHTAKMDKLAMMMAADRAKDWGTTEHRSFFTGHIHTETSREVAGVRVESLQALAARDAWNASMGYRSGRSIGAITFHKENGEIGRHRVNIATPKQG